MALSDILYHAVLEITWKRRDISLYCTRSEGVMVFISYTVVIGIPWRRSGLYNFFMAAVLEIPWRRSVL